MDQLERIQSHLERWAEAQDIPVDADRYVLDPSANFLLELSPETLADLSKGGGSELGLEGSRGKIQALHSSSALACNVFEYWRQREDRTALEQALGLRSRILEIRFEQPFPTGLKGTSPHLDVVLETEGGLVAVESKYLEPYRGTGKESPFSDSYFPSGQQLWVEVGLPQCQEFAKAIQRREVVFEYLNAAQLLKHALGLWNTGRSDLSLWYLWLDPGDPHGTRHAEEIDHFKSEVGSELRFVSWQYSEFLDRIDDADVTSELSEYLTYLRRRYFLHEA